MNSLNIFKHGFQGKISRLTCKSKTETCSHKDLRELKHYIKYIKYLMKNANDDHPKGCKRGMNRATFF